MRMRHVLTLTGFLLAAASVSGQAPSAGLDRATITRIRAEAIDKSQAVDHLWWLSEVYGPRASGTPAFEAASQWAMKKFTEWGLTNVHPERFPFGQGWSIERFSLHLVEPQTQALIGQPRWNSPSTNGPVLADVVYVRAATEDDLGKYQGQLRGKIVVMQPVRAVRLLDGRVVLRMTEADWSETMVVPAETAAGPSDRARAAAQFAAAVQRFLVSEGAAALLERGSDGDLSAGGSDLSWQTQRVDGGTIFPGNGGSRDPQAPAQVPSVTMAVEHYNRIVRLLEHGMPVKVEVNIQAKFHPETNPEGNGINTVAEIRGTDLANEVVDGSASRQLPLCRRRDRQRHRFGRDDGGGPGHSDARPEAAADDSRRAVGRRGTGAARLARIRAAALSGRQRLQAGRARDRRCLLQPR